MTRQQRVVINALKAENGSDTFGVFVRIASRLRMTPAAAKMRFHRYKLANGYKTEPRIAGRSPVHIAQSSVCGEI